MPDTLFEPPPAPTPAHIVVGEHHMRLGGMPDITAQVLVLVCSHRAGHPLDLEWRAWTAASDDDPVARDELPLLIEHRPADLTANLRPYLDQTGIRAAVASVFQESLESIRRAHGELGVAAAEAMFADRVAAALDDLRRQPSPDESEAS